MKRRPFSFVFEWFWHVLVMARATKAVFSGTRARIRSWTCKPLSQLPFRRLGDGIRHGKEQDIVTEDVEAGLLFDDILKTTPKSMKSISNG